MPQTMTVPAFGFATVEETQRYVDDYLMFVEVARIASMIRWARRGDKK